jgi:hypothetical protein
MSKTIIGFMVEDEITFSIVIDDNDINAEAKKAKYLSNPIIIETTNLPYSPVVGSIWDGVNFIIPEGSALVHESTDHGHVEHNEARSFAFVVNNTCTGRINLMPRAEGVISALLSNPTFLDITEMVYSLPSGVNYHGKFVRNGEIVSR